jgi:RNA polymerase sigma-70 factor (ECF subfamily)
MRTWLYGICLRVASDYRRKAHRRREELSDEVPERNSEPPQTPEEWVALGQARQQLAAVLDSMTLEKRSVFVMFEIDGLSCAEIATIVGVPVGTIYSRIHAARKDFVRSVKRLDAMRSTGGAP